MSTAAALPDAAQVVAGALARMDQSARPAFLRELLAHTAAGLVVVEGDRQAAEAVYRLADAVALGREAPCV